LEKGQEANITNKVNLVKIKRVINFSNISEVDKEAMDTGGLNGSNSEHSMFNVGRSMFILSVFEVHIFYQAFQSFPANK
jgi:hypothetical protein